MACPDGARQLASDADSGRHPLRGLLMWTGLMRPVRARASAARLNPLCRGAPPWRWPMAHHDRNRRHRADDPRPASRSGAARRTPERPQFQRLLIWFCRERLSTFTYADYPERWVPDAPEQLKKNCREYRKSLSLVRTAAGRRAVGAGRVGNVAGLLYRGDVPLGTPPGVV